jgi:hypothetical protein
MSPRADSILLLSVDHDPADDRLAAIGYRRIQGGEIRNQRIEIPQSGSIAEDEAMVSVLGALIDDRDARVVSGRSSPQSASPTARFTPKQAADSPEFEGQ